MSIRPLLAAIGLAGLVACTPAPQAPAAALDSVAPAAETPAGATVSGEVFYLERIALPETAMLVLEVLDLSRTPDVDDLVLKTETPAGPGSPVAFSVTVPADTIAADANLVLRPRIQDGFAILMAAESDTPVATSGETSGLSIRLMTPEAIQAAKGAPMITPGGTAYDCGGETLTIAIEAGAAYVTFADDTSEKLDKLDGTPEGVTRFSNGRLMVEDRRDEYGASTIQFGRSETMPVVKLVPCTVSA